MGWDRVIGQARAVAALQRAVESDRVAHAMLFHGPEGTGKRAAGIALARALMCTDACGQCDACSKVDRLIHPDFQVLFPVHKDVKASEIRPRLDQLAADPYATIDFVRRTSLSDPSKSTNKQVIYSIARMHELQRVMSLRPVEGRYKVALLTDVDLLRKESANAFLKLLEEPTPQTVFILTTDRVDRLLPTIVSRCQQIRFDPLPTDAIAAALVQRLGMSDDTAQTVARMADGSYSRARDLAELDDLMAARNTVVVFLRNAYQAWKAADTTAEQIEKMSRLGREPLKFVFTLMLGWIRDLMLMRTLGPSAPIVNIDQAVEIENFCRKLPDADLEGMAAMVEEAGYMIVRNVNSRLVLTVLAQQLGEAMRGQGDGRLYVPLDQTI